MASPGHLHSTSNSEYMLHPRFNFTKHLSDASTALWLFTSITGAVLCFSVLLAIFIVAFRRRSRAQLDRVSFRLVCYSLLANTAFGIANAVGGSFTGPTPACGLAIWILQLTLQLSSLLNFCIALNMQLVIVHGIDGRKAEKFYVLCSSLLSLCITIPPYAARQYGWDELVQECWYANDDKHQRLVWQISTQLLWTGLTVIGEVCSSIILITFLWRHVVRRKRIVHSVNSIANHSAITSHTTAGGKGRHRSDSVFGRRGRQADHVREYKGIIIRIALYPLFSCIINLTSIVCVIHTTARGGVHDRTDYNFLLLSDFLYGGRGIVYGLLAATDPALIRAVRSFLNFRSRSSSSGPAVVRVELTTTTIRDPPPPDGLEFEAQAPPEEEGSANMGYKYPPQIGEGSGPKSPSLGNPGTFADLRRVRGEERLSLETRGIRESSLDLERKAFQKQI